jgi:PIN domain nuclease of toxin-antitoxin system
MNLLVDTHVLLWWLGDSPELPAVARELLIDNANIVHVSVASIWEISIKKSTGKLKIPDAYQDTIASQGFVELPMTWTHARAAGELPPIHRDPFDRMLIAQAIVERLSLLTVDTDVRKYAVTTVP